jgi:hypothetical protein
MKWMLSGVYEHAISKGVVEENPVIKAKWLTKAKKSRQKIECSLPQVIEMVRVLALSPETDLGRSLTGFDCHPVAESGYRTQKILEDANIKLGSVASDILGKSGRATAGHHGILRGPRFQSFEDGIETKAGIGTNPNLPNVGRCVGKASIEELEAAIPCASVAGPQLGIP